MTARRSRWSDGDDQNLAHGIDRIRAAVTRDLLPRTPRAAADLQMRLIQRHPSIVAQVRDSGGVVGSAIEDVVADFGVVCAALPTADRRKLPAEVITLLLADEYGVCRRLIHACKDALGPEGLAELDRLFRAGLEGMGLAGGAQHQRTCLDGLAEVANARGDVDAFIEVQHLVDIEDRAVMPIAERLAIAGRLDEALQRLEQATGGEHRFSGLDDLKIEVLDRLGRVDDAQAVRWGVFVRVLSGTMLDAYLERVPTEARPGVTEKAVAAAQRHRDAYAALSLLSNLAPESATGLVCRRLQELSGYLDLILRPASACLAEVHPLAAVLLRHKIVDAALARARTTVADMRKLVRNCGTTLAGSRDRALLLIGFAGALRRSELVGLNVANVTWTSEGMELLITRSKTDAEGAGARIGINRGKAAEMCPVTALQTWLTEAALNDGPIFRKVNRGGVVERTRLTAGAVRDILLKRAQQAGIKGTWQEPVSPHGLRAGFVTAAYRNGVPDEEIMGHTSMPSASRPSATRSPPFGMRSGARRICACPGPARRPSTSPPAFCKDSRIPSVTLPKMWKVELRIRVKHGHKLIRAGF